MAFYHGYVIIPHNTYLAWRGATLNNSYDVDNFPTSQPYQCWDFTAEFWHNLGFPENYPLTGGDDAKGVWTQRLNNVSYNGVQYFELVTAKESIKKGDVIVFNPSGWIGETGHIAFADEDYNGTDYIACLGQNQSGHAYVDVQNLSLSSFAGAFRCLEWTHTPPIVRPMSKFKWLLYARKRRESLY